MVGSMAVVSCTWTLVEKSVRFQMPMSEMIGSEHSYRRGMDDIGVVAGVVFLYDGECLFSQVIS